MYQLMTTHFLYSLEEIQGKEAEAVALSWFRTWEAVRSCGIPDMLVISEGVMEPAAPKAGLRH